MNRENYKGLVKELNKLGFDNRVNEPLETNIRQCKPNFSFSYGTQPFLHDFEEGWLIYELHFQRNIWNGEYIFIKCDAQLLLPVDIPHRTISGIQTDLLEQQLQNLHWDIPFTKRTKEEHLIIGAAVESLAIIGSDEQGAKIACLLTAKYRYLFEFFENVYALKGLNYDKDTDLFYLQNTIHPSEINRIADIEQMMTEMMDSLTTQPPSHSYSLHGTGFKMNPETQIQFSFSRQFYSINEACSFLQNVDDMLFSQRMMSEHNAPWYLRKLTVIDNNDKQPLLSKRVQEEHNVVNKTTELFLLYEINDKKLSLSEFMAQRVGVSVSSDRSQVITNFQKCCTILDPPSTKHQEKTASDNTRIRQHRLNRPGKKL